MQTVVLRAEAGLPFPRFVVNAAKAGGRRVTLGWLYVWDWLLRRFRPRA